MQLLLIAALAALIDVLAVIALVRGNPINQVQDITATTE
jgi:hypothetical protein